MSKHKRRKRMVKPLRLFAKNNPLRLRASDGLTHVVISPKRSAFVPTFDLRWHDDRYHIYELEQSDETPHLRWTLHDDVDMAIFIDVLKGWLRLRSGRHEPPDTDE